MRQPDRLGIPFQHVADAQLSSDLLDIDSLALVGEARIARDDEKRFKARECGDDVFYHPIREVFLLGIAAHVLERKHCDGRFVGQRERYRGIFRRSDYRCSLYPYREYSNRLIDVLDLLRAEISESKR